MKGRIQLSRCHEMLIITCLILALFSVIPGCNIGGSFKGFDGISPGSSSNPSQVISLSSTEIDFGSVTSGSVKSEPISISNQGSEDIMLNDLYLENSSEFSLNLAPGITPANNAPIVISAGDTIILEIRFSPSFMGDFASILHIYCNNSEQNDTVDIYVYGKCVVAPIPDLNISPSSYDFGDVLTSTESKHTEIRISNTGTADLTITDMVIQDTTNFSVDFEGGNAPCGSNDITLPPGYQCTVNVAFSPINTGAFGTMFSIISDDPDKQLFNIQIAGNGTSQPPPDGFVTVSWIAPSTNVDGSTLTDLGGFKIHFGSSPGNYTQTIDTGMLTTYTINGLSSGTWYFSVTAYDDSGNESSFSTEVSTNI